VAGECRLDASARQLLARYAGRIVRIKGGLGDTAVSDLRPEHVQEWLTKLQKGGLLASTAQVTPA
jgi:hypothetical protein